MVLSRPLPFTVRDYVFTEEIGKGGFSKVFKVINKKFNSEFVAKVIQAMKTEHLDLQWETFDAEVKALTALDHPYIIRLYDHFHENADFFIILEYCPNGSLYGEMKEKGAMELERFRDIGRQILEALSYCHKMSFAHHDIKPQNILIDAYGRAKLADFGLSLRLKNGNLSNSFAGSIMFTPPEIFAKRAHDGFKADIWSLGVLFAVLISGDSPWPTVPIDRLKQLICVGAYQIKHKIHPDVSEIIRRMIVVDPNQRITADELLQLPFFQKKEYTEDSFSENPTDPLSPRGRKILSPSNSQMPRRMSSSSAIDAKVDFLKERSSSKALLIGCNSMFGINRASAFKKRYQPNLSTVTPTFV